MAKLIALVWLVACSNSADPQKIDIARETTKHLAFEAYSMWARAHVDHACPDSIDALAPYMDAKSMTDPWGHPYKLLCGKDLPPGAKAVVAISLGPDGKEGTSDDIKSGDK